MSGSIFCIQTCPGHRQHMRPLDRAELVDGGIPGDAHFAPGSVRQVLLIERETLQELGLEPGTVKENVTTEGLVLMDLPAGTRLATGTAVLEVTKECEPCERMEEIRDGLRAELVRRRGILAKVIQPGLVRVGDEVRVVEPTGETEPAGQVVPA